MATNEETQRVMTQRRPRWSIARGLGPVLLILLWCGCSARHYRERVDRRAYKIIAEEQQQAFNHTEPFTIEQPADTLRRRLLLDQNLPYAAPASLGSELVERPPHWPESAPKPENKPIQRGVTPTNAVLRLTLNEALQIAARNSRDYQSQKEAVFRAALELELERDQFRTSFSGLLSALFRHDRSQLSEPGGQVTEAVEASALADASKVFQNGSVVTLQLGLNLLKLIEPARFTSESVFGDASISIPLMRGAGRHIVREPLTQAERDILYALRAFEHYKSSFAVTIASRYLSVLQQGNQVQNAEENYRGLVASSRRARRFLDAGNLPSIQVDQSIQDELRARNRWVSARESFASAVDSFKLVLGLPADASIELAPEELDKLLESVQRLTEQSTELEANAPVPPADAPIELKEPSIEHAGRLELDSNRAIQIALTNRLDLQNAVGRVHDALRRTVVAANRLKPELTLFGSAELRGDMFEGLDPNTGSYRALLNVNLPFERTAEAIAYRGSLIAIEDSVRDLQAAEDQIKLSVLDRLRELREARESLRIQAVAVELARRRVRGATLTLQAGRIEIRDLLEAQEDLLSAQNALTAAAVSYRVAELALQRDLGVLRVEHEGLWEEYEPDVVDQ